MDADEIMSTLMDVDLRLQDILIVAVTLREKCGEGHALHSKLGTLCDDIETAQEEASDLYDDAQNL